MSRSIHVGDFDIEVQPILNYVCNYFKFGSHSYPIPPFSEDLWWKNFDTRVLHDTQTEIFVFAERCKGLTDGKIQCSGYRVIAARICVVSKYRSYTDKNGKWHRQELCQLQIHLIVDELYEFFTSLANLILEKFKNVNFALENEQVTNAEPTPIVINQYHNQGDVNLVYLAEGAQAGQVAAGTNTTQTNRERESSD